MSAYDEIREHRRFGPLCLALTLRLLSEEVRRFPALTPEQGWQPAELEDLLGEFLVDRIKPVTANLLALATDEDSLGKLLRTSIRRWLVDRARTTAVGALRRALEKVLSTTSDFEQVPATEPGAGRWRLAGSGGAPWGGKFEHLVEAARGVPNVKIPKWSSETRRAPVADSASIAAVAKAVLAAAGGSLELGQLVVVFLARFPVVLDPVVISLDEDAGTPVDLGDELTPEEQVVAAEQELEAAVVAAEIVGMLAPRERKIVPYLDNPRAIQALLGIGRSQAYQRAKRLKEKLAQLIGDSGDASAVAREVIWLCKNGR
ncbi:hypothetical protein GCM10022247_55520 [Allokutzneria multivorans]|uniref:Uncharacterized protein n=1 Tax=Allokutzneria multivorans TaxID=1142134 RepID=A0ABP7TDQ8_9PSEU